jgi:hypothetical protein
MMFMGCMESIELGTDMFKDVDSATAAELKRRYEDAAGGITSDVNVTQCLRDRLNSMSWVKRSVYKNGTATGLACMLLDEIWEQVDPSLISEIDYCVWHPSISVLAGNIADTTREVDHD